MDARNIISWSKSHLVASIIGIGFAISGFIHFVPPYECCLIWQRQIEAVFHVIYGLGNIVALPSFFLPAPFSIVLYIVVLFMCGLALGLLLETFWEKKWQGRLVILFVLATNILPGLFIVTFSNTLIGKPYATCEKYVSETTAIRVVAYPEKGFVPGAHFFFSTTSDKGKTWKQFMHFRHDDPIDPPCENIRSSDSEHFWVWASWQVAMTNDAGSTWHIWHPQQTWNNWVCCNYGLVKDVIFRDARTGYMLLDPIPGRHESSELYTQDGGETWK